jgi:mannose-6-phosphate isomerase-like protein (cupin superfamily)
MTIENGGTASGTNLMASKPSHERARLVVTGEDSGGRSVVVSDATFTDWIRRPTGLLITEVWRADSLPAHVSDESSAQEGKISALAAAGLSVRIAVFPPDEDVDAAKMASYEASMRDLYGDQGGQPGSEIAGMHRTDTIDIVTVVDGEIWVLLDEGEALLQTGDCLVQRGTRHAWRNRTDRPCTLVSVVLPASRD